MFANVDRSFRAKFVDMLSQIVRECDDPKKVHFKLVGIGAVHSAAGVKPAHMKYMGEMIMMAMVRAPSPSSPTMLHPVLILLILSSS